MRTRVFDRLACCSAAKCLLVAVWLLAVWSFAAGAAWAQTVQLDPQTQPRNVAEQALWWLEQDAQLTVVDVAAQPGEAVFAANPSGAMFRLTAAKRLWAQLNVVVPKGADGQWMLSVPLPLIDSVTLYQPIAGGKWTAQTAGDSVAVRDWPERGRYPRFRLQLPEGPTTLYLQIRGSTPVSLPIEIATITQADEASQTGYLAMGALMGALLLLALVCFAWGHTYRDRLYVLYGFYALAIIVATAAYTGLAAQLLWDNSPRWADAAQGCLALLTGGAAMFFVNAITAVDRHSPRWSRALLALGVLGPLLALLYFYLNRPAGVWLLAVYMVCVSTAGLKVAYATWARGDAVGKWVFIAYLPLIAMIFLAIARAIGWVPVSWLVQYGVLVAMVFEVPLLMVALGLRSRERHAAQTREEALATHDALTGLLAPQLFHDRLRQTVARAKRHREDAAVVFIELVNYGSIMRAHGATVAEHSLLRSVIKLRRLLRDVDTASRVGPFRFGLILEGVAQREAVTQIAARLIAMGLMPLKGLQPDVTLQFHIATAMLSEVHSDAQDLQARLHALLQSMSHRTRRPIRYLDPHPTDLMPLQAPHSELPSSDPPAAPAWEHSEPASGGSGHSQSAESQSSSHFPSQIQPQPGLQSKT